MTGRPLVSHRLRARAVALLTATVAVLAAGVGLAVPASATPGGPPTLVSLTPGPASLTPTWTAPAMGTDTFYRWDMSFYDNTTTSQSFTGFLYNPSTLSYTRPGLSGGDSWSVTITVEYNGGSSSQASNTLTASVPVSAPSAPFFSQPMASAGSGPNQAVVSWNPWVANGSAITGYTIAGIDSTNSANNVSASAGASATSVTASGLTTGDSYTFTVTATNGIGAGPASPASPAVVARSTPAAPAAPSATAGPGANQAMVTWVAPAINGSAITGYTIAGVDFTNTAHNVSTTAGAGATSVTVSGLTAGENYTFTVLATNGLGAGAASAASSSLVALSTPGVPTGVAGVAAGSSVQLSWVAPGSTGGSALTGYLISYTDTGTSVTLTQPSTGSALTATVAGLVTTHSYTFTVAAVNLLGTGTASTASSAVAIPVPVAPLAPGAPATFVVGATAGGARVSWTAPTDIGTAAVTGYVVTYLDRTHGTGSVVHTPGASTTSDAAVLQPGDHYAVTMSAVNPVGTGPASAAAMVIPFTTPDAPAGVAATAGDSVAHLSWTAPADGFSPITGYSVSFSDATHPGSPGAVTTTGTGTSTLVTGLTDGDSYTFTVTATNAAGSGAVSTASAPVTPQAPVVPAPVTPAPVVRAVQAPARVAVGGHGSSTVVFRFTLDRPVPVTVSLVAANGAVVGSARLNPKGTTVAAAVSVHLARVAQLGHARWVVSATASRTVLLTRGVVLKQASMLGMRATRSGGRVTVAGSAKWNSLATGSVQGWVGERIQVQAFGAHGWRTIAVARTDALGHLRVGVTVAAGTRLRLVDTASPTVAAGISAVSTV